MPIGAQREASPPTTDPTSIFFSLTHKNVQLSHPFLHCNFSLTNSYGSKFRVLKGSMIKSFPSSLLPGSQFIVSGASSSK